MASLENTDASEVDTFVVNLRKQVDGQVVVSSVELLLPEMRNRYSFKNAKRLHDLFSKGLADRFDAILSRLTPSERIVSMPDFEYAGPGIVMAGLRVLITAAEDGAEMIMLRIHHYVGAIKSVFRFDPTMAVGSTSTRERIAVDVLQDIISPLFDLMSLDVPGMDQILEKHSHAIRKRLTKISARQEEIVFFTGLLQRYVSGCQQDARRQDLLGQAKKTDNNPSPPRLTGTA